jgi:mycofactocin glycosyltransferase
VTTGVAAQTIGALPAGFRVDMDADTKQLSDGSLFGGSPGRVMRLTPAGAAALEELRAGPVRSAAAGQLARRLTDGGLAHPIPPPDPAIPDAVSVTVIIPVRDRPDMLERCLAATGAQYPVVVIDDGSADPDAIAAIVARHGAALIRRAASGGPAAARNAGLAGIDADLIAFLDSDCVPPPDWISRLAAHFADPLVGAVAPRIVAMAPSATSAPASTAPASTAPPSTAPASTAPAGTGPAARYAAVRGSLDLGPRPARIKPGSRVSYAPTAALLVRRTALDAVTAGRDLFDPDLRYGEDVDLIWRLHEAGWRIRYEPAVQVPHQGPKSWPGLLGRRFSYGTSAAPLARRHPANMTPLVLHPWPAVTVAALLARRPAAAAAAVVAAWFDLTSAVRRAGVPADGAPAATLTAVHQTWLGVGRYATQFAAPALVVALARPGGKSAAHRFGRRAAAASLLLGPALTAYAERKPDLDPVRYSLAHIADDICYGAGVWTGCLRERTIVPVRPLISWRPLSSTGQRARSRKG